MLQAVTYDIEVDVDLKPIQKNIYKTDFDLHDYMYLQMVWQFIDVPKSPYHIIK